jgi:hypothetical protein
MKFNGELLVTLLRKLSFISVFNLKGGDSKKI